MKRELTCTNEQCFSEIFTCSLVVGPSGELVENPEKIEGEYFTCCECYYECEWVELDG